MNDFVRKVKSGSNIELEDFTRDGYKTVIVRIPRSNLEELTEIASESGYVRVDEYEDGREIICQFERN